MGGTFERIKKGKGKKTTIKDATKRRKEGCGAWYFSYLPEGPEPTMVKGTEYKGKGKNKKQHTRWSFDHLIYFFYNPKNNCKDYAFMQFVERKTKRLKFTGDKYTELSEIPKMSHEWQPDIEGWDKRTTKGFVDPTEILYKLQSRTKDGQKKTKAHGAEGIVRRDGPGYSYRKGTRKPRNLKISYKFRVYVVCDVLTDLKVVGFVEYAFSIVVNQHGIPHLEFSKPSLWENFTGTTVCCNKSKAFDTWISKWRIYLWMGPPPYGKSKQKKSKSVSKPVRLEDTQKIVDQSKEGRKKPLRTKRKK